MIRFDHRLFAPHRSSTRALWRRVLWVEELENRYAPATLGFVGPLALSPPTTSAPVVQPLVADAKPESVEAVTTSSTPIAQALKSGITLGTPPGGFANPGAGAGTPTIVTGTSTTAPSLAVGTLALAGTAGASALTTILPTQNGLVEAVVQSNSTPVIGLNYQNSLPPILQGSSIVPLSGPPTLADLQRLTANFVGGGHVEQQPAPRNAARPSPSPFLADGQDQDQEAMVAQVAAAAAPQSPTTPEQE